MGATAVRPTRPKVPMGLLVALGAGALVTVALGVYGRVHDPTGETVVTAVFSGQIQFKAWMRPPWRSSSPSRSC